jgi:TRAP-type C4-dicarboxylate transport system permease small subunit
MTPFRLLGRIEAVIAGTFLVLMVLLIFAGGVARMVGAPLNWTVDVATALFAWACFLCADIAWRNDNLMSVDIVTARLPESLRGLLETINYLLISAFLLYVIGAGLWLSWISRARTFQGMPEISYSIVTLSMPVGGLLLLITTLRKLVAHHRRTRVAAPPAT